MVQRRICSGCSWNFDRIISTFYLDTARSTSSICSLEKEILLDEKGWEEVRAKISDLSGHSGKLMDFLIQRCLLYVARFLD